MDPGWEVEAPDEARQAEVLASGDGRTPPTLAELMGMTGEIGEAILAVAAGELEQGRPELARTILEGQVCANPMDADGWILLARAHRAMREPLAARFCAEVAARLAPTSPAARLARAEGLLPFASERAVARGLLEGLCSEVGPEGERARALLQSMQG